jgi:hypothetical protein
MTTSHPIFTGTPQFDGGRWKLRLDCVPLDFFKQFTASADLDSTAGAGTKTESNEDPVKNEATR